MLQQRKAPQSVHGVLASPGRPLDSETRAFFGPRFTHDFTRGPATSPPHTLTIGAPDDAFEREADRNERRALDLTGVRVHTDAAAAASAHDVNARAYTVGSHIVFGAGQYAPHTDGGRRLLAHELAHAAQQQEGSVSRTLQRSLTVQKPADPAPNQPFGSKTTNAELVQSWVDKLCGSGWTVNKTSGLLSIANRDTFCGDGLATAKFPRSCRCLCDVTAAGSPTVLLHTGDTFQTPNAEGTKTETHDVTGSGQGGTRLPSGKRTETHVGISGREGFGVRGAGATAAPQGKGRSQMLQDPPWIIFAHEVCGHALPATDDHVQWPGGATSAVDIENRIRREHSTLKNNLGIRRGHRPAEDPNDPNSRVETLGSYVVAREGETIAKVAERLGIPKWRAEIDVMTSDGDRFTQPKRALDAGQLLFVRNVFYHDVIAGETVESIAATWEVSVASLRRTNPSLPERGAVAAGTRLLIPVS